MDDVCQNYNKQQLLSLNTKLAVVKSLLWHLILTIHFEHTSIFIYLNLANIFEPVHEISNNVVCATSKASDQPAHTRSLIRALASRLSNL